MIAVAGEREPVPCSPAEFAGRVHELCPGGTWCDCQHVVPPGRISEQSLSLVASEHSIQEPVTGEMTGRAVWA